MEPNKDKASLLELASRELRLAVQAARRNDLAAVDRHCRMVDALVRQARQIDTK